MVCQHCKPREGQLFIQQVEKVRAFEKVFHQVRGAGSDLAAHLSELLVAMIGLVAMPALPVQPPPGRAVHEVTLLARWRQ